jgi:hypothetical protein
MKNTFRVFVKEGVLNQSQFARTNENSFSDVYNTDSEFFPEIPNVAGTDYTTIKREQLLILESMPCIIMVVFVQQQLHF